MTIRPTPPPPRDIDDLLRETMAWGRFAASLRHENRYVPRDKEYVSRLLGELLSTQASLGASSDLFRARKLPFDRANALRAFPLDQMGAPPPGHGGGRLNPDGLPCLYTAGDAKTAIAEVRPWKRATICVARLTTVREVNIVDLTHGFDGGEASACVRAFAQVVSAPVQEGDALSYVSTQYVAELLRHEGVSGVRYPSSLRETGINVALFDPSAAEVQEVVLHEVLSVSYGSGEVSKSRIELAKLLGGQ